MDETPGTYWCHSHPRHAFTIHSINAIHGPLNVHPTGEKSRSLVDSLNAGDGNAINSWYYDDERLLFFSDGFLTSGSIRIEEKKSYLVHPNSKSDSGWTVGTSLWGRDVYWAVARRKVLYKFRIINVSSHYGLRINVGA